MLLVTAEKHQLHDTTHQRQGTGCEHAISMSVSSEVSSPRLAAIPEWQRFT